MPGGGRAGAPAARGDQKLNENDAAMTGYSL
jgi:hypothetical protein